MSRQRTAPAAASAEKVLESLCSLLGVGAQDLQIAARDLGRIPGLMLDDWSVGENDRQLLLPLGLPRYGLKSDPRPALSGSGNELRPESRRPTWPIENNRNRLTA